MDLDPEERYDNFEPRVPPRNSENVDTHVLSIVVPLEFEMDDFDCKWKYKIEPHIEKYVKIVQDVHDNMEYTGDWMSTKG